MISVLFPPGCYGTYVARCLFHYTSLSPQLTSTFTFDINGSSHDHRSNPLIKNVIETTHEYHAGVDTVHIIPDLAHGLDYVNNQFAKQTNYNTAAFVDSMIAANDFTTLIKKQWGIDAASIDKVPTWVMREFFSFYLPDCLAQSYSCSAFDLPVATTVTANDVIDDIIVVIKHISAALSLTVKSDTAVMIKNHDSFIAAQKYHNSQIRCTEWVYDCLQDGDSLSPCQTLFDEAYVQHLLRTQGYEMQCDGLNTFPGTAEMLRKIIY